MTKLLADSMFKFICLIVQLISIQISLEFVSEATIDNKSVSMQVSTWRWTVDKPLPESRSKVTHIGVIRPE